MAIRTACTTVANTQQACMIVTHIRQSLGCRSCPIAIHASKLQAHHQTPPTHVCNHWQLCRQLHKACSQAGRAAQGGIRKYVKAAQDSAQHRLAHMHVHAWGITLNWVGEHSCAPVQSCDRRLSSRGCIKDPMRSFARRCSLPPSPQSSAPSVCCTQLPIYSCCPSSHLPCMS